MENTHTHTVTTLNMNDNTIQIDLMYPRVEDRPSAVNISLYDVRAANDIIVAYDFDRDGWSIRSDCYDIDQHEESGEIYEVAFIPAWPTKPEH